jgi:hypothetical protein
MAENVFWSCVAAMESGGTTKWLSVMTFQLKGLTNEGATTLSIMTLSIKGM